MLQYSCTRHEEEASNSHAKPNRFHNKTFHEVKREEPSDLQDNAELQPISPRDLGGLALQRQLKPYFHHARSC